MRARKVYISLYEIPLDGDVAVYRKLLTRSEVVRDWFKRITETLSLDWFEVRNVVLRRKKMTVATVQARN